MDQRELSGAELAQFSYADVVGPLLARALPRLKCAAGRLGSGSDVLGLDDATSRDHDWGCRLTLLVDQADRDVVLRISELLERELPAVVRGLSGAIPGHLEPLDRTQGRGRDRRRLRRQPAGRRPDGRAVGAGFG